MDLTKVLAQLRLELDHIDAAILSLERLQANKALRGRPAKALIDIRKFRPAHPGKPSAPSRMSRRYRILRKRAAAFSVCSVGLVAILVGVKHDRRIGLLHARRSHLPD